MLLVVSHNLPVYLDDDNDDDKPCGYLQNIVFYAVQMTFSRVLLWSVFTLWIKAGVFVLLAKTDPVLK